MKNLVQIMCIVTGIILLLILGICLMISGYHLGQVWDNYLTKYSGLKETKICKVLK